MPEPTRILHVIGVMNRGGAENMIMNLYRNIDRTKIQFDFVENEGEEAAFDAEIKSLGGKIYHCPRYRGKNHFAYIKWWNNFFKEHKGEYQIVHGHIGSTAAIYLSIAKKHGAFAIAHSHSAGVGSAMYRVFAYPTRYVADQFFACSRDAGVSRYGSKVGGNPKLCQVLNNAIDTQKFVYRKEVGQTMRQQLSISENALVIGHVGRFIDAKNHMFLVDVFEKVYQRNSNSVMLLVGDGELRPQIEKAIAEKHLETAVIMTGVQADVWNYYQAMDVFAFPSVYEGLPVSLVEAQAAGLPCCVSDAVPRESAITDLVEFISLDISAANWADCILKRPTHSRNDRVSEVKQAGYDIASTARWLEKYYLGCKYSSK